MPRTGETGCALRNVERVRRRLCRVAQILQLADGRHESKSPRNAQHTHDSDTLSRRKADRPRRGRYHTGEVLNAAGPDVVHQLLNEEKRGSAAPAEEFEACTNVADLYRDAVSPTDVRDWTLATIEIPCVEPSGPPAVSVALHAVAKSKVVRTQMDRTTAPVSLPAQLATRTVGHPAASLARAGKGHYL